MGGFTSRARVLHESALGNDVFVRVRAAALGAYTESVVERVADRTGIVIAAGGSEGTSYVCFASTAPFKDDEAASATCFLFKDENLEVVETPTNAAAYLDTARRLRVDVTTRVSERGATGTLVRLVGDAARVAATTSTSSWGVVVCGYPATARTLVLTEYGNIVHVANDADVVAESREHDAATVRRLRARARKMYRSSTEHLRQPTRRSKRARTLA